MKAMARDGWIPDNEMLYKRYSNYKRNPYNNLLLAGNNLLFLVLCVLPAVSLHLAAYPLFLYLLAAI